MSEANCSPTKQALYKLVEYEGKASTRDHIYQRLSLETGLSESSIRAAASRSGLTSSSRSLRCIFSEEEEDALVQVCVILAREGRPFTIPAFIRVASIFAEKENEESFLAYSFFRKFMKRHSDSLCKRKGIITSETRTYRAMLEKTEEFITLINSKLEKNTMNSKNIVVFDETVIGDDVSVPIVIGERRKSGGGNIHVSYTRDAALGCYIPFSMPDGTTPFRVYIFKSEELKEEGDILYALSPAEDRELRSHPHMIFLESEKGYLTTAHFRYIMDQFIEWWTSTRSGLECFLISDNLRIHTNKDIVMKAREKGIHMFNIMPGTSHWFQVHDQQPFGGLKKKMSQKKFELLTSTDIPREDRRDLLKQIFYEAESEAFNTRTVQKAFAEVGLWPWNPEKILEMCREHSPVLSLPLQNRLVNKIFDIIRMIDEEKKGRIDRMLCGLKRVRVVTMKEMEMDKSQNKDDTLTSLDEDEEEGAQRLPPSMSMSIESPAKRRRVIKRSCIRCSVKRCQKTHFWSKKWVSCSKCHKNFCPLHKNRLRYHKC